MLIQQFTKHLVTQKRLNSRSTDLLTPDNEPTNTHWHIWRRLTKIRSYGMWRRVVWYKGSDGMEYPAAPSSWRHSQL